MLIPPASPGICSQPTHFLLHSHLATETPFPFSPASSCHQQASLPEATIYLIGPSPSHVSGHQRLQVPPVQRAPPHTQVPVPGRGAGARLEPAGARNSHCAPAAACSPTHRQRNRLNPSGTAHVVSYWLQFWLKVLHCSNAPSNPHPQYTHTGD